MKKLSEMNANELCKALCDIAAPIGNIARDDEVVEALKQIAEKRRPGTALAKFFGVSFSALVPLLLNKHKADTFAVLSVLKGKTVSEVEQENGFQLVRDLRALFQTDLIRFFGSSVDMV